MGLYINGRHGQIYKTEEKLVEPNQDMIKVDRLSEWIDEQKRINKSLFRSYYFLNQISEKQEQTQNQILNTLDEYGEIHLEQENIQNQMLERVTMLEANHHRLEAKVDNDKISKEEVINQLKQLYESNQKIMEEIKSQQSVNEKLSEQFEEYVNMQLQIKQIVEEHDHQQKQMMNRLENQEALIEKLGRQLGNLRSILYERTHHLAEKIEDQYEMTSTYVHQLITGSNEPLTLLLSKQKSDK